MPKTYFIVEDMIVYPGVVSENRITDSQWEEIALSQEFAEAKAAIQQEKKPSDMITHQPDKNIGPSA